MNGTMLLAGRAALVSVGRVVLECEVRIGGLMLQVGGVPVVCGLVCLRSSPIWTVRSLMDARLMLFDDKVLKVDGKVLPIDETNVTVHGRHRVELQFSIGQ